MGGGGVGPENTQYYCIWCVPFALQGSTLPCGPLGSTLTRGPGKKQRRIRSFTLNFCRSPRHRLGPSDLGPLLPLPVCCSNESARQTVAFCFYCVCFVVRRQTVAFCFYCVCFVVRRQTVAFCFHCVCFVVTQQICAFCFHCVCFVVSIACVL